MEVYIARLLVSFLIGAVLGGIGCSVKDRSAPLFLTFICGFVWAVVLTLLGTGALLLWLFERSDVIASASAVLLGGPHVIWVVFSFWTGIAVMFWIDYFKSAR